MDTWNAKLERAIYRRVDSANGKNSRWQRFRSWLYISPRGARFSELIFFHVAPVLLSLLIAMMAGEKVAAAWLAVFFLGLALMSAGRVQWSLFEPSFEAGIWGNLPLADGRVFGLRWSGLVREFRDRFWGGLLMGWLLLGFPNSFVMCLWIPVFAVLHWLAMGALTSLFAAGARPHGAWLSGLGLIMGTLIVLSTWKNNWQETAETIAGYVNALCPTAWAMQLLMGMNEASAVGIWVLAPLLLLLATQERWLKMLRDRYRYEEPGLPEKDPWVWDEISAALPHEVSEIVDQKLFAMEMRGTWVYRMSFGFVEKAVYRWLNERERLLLEAFGSFPLGFTVGWRHGWWLLLAVTPLMCLVDYRTGIPMFVGLIVPFLLAGLTFSGHAMASNATSANCAGCEGAGLMRIGGYPVGYDELLWMAWKGCAVRTLFGLPHLLFFGVLTALAMEGAFSTGGQSSGWHMTVVWTGLQAALEFAAMILIAFPFFWTSGYACFRSDKRGSTVMFVLDFLVLVPIVMVAMAMAVVVIFSSHLLLSVAGLGGMAILIWLGTPYLRWRSQGRDLIVVEADY